MPRRWRQTAGLGTSGIGIFIESDLQYASVQKNLECGAHALDLISTLFCKQPASKFEKDVVCSLDRLFTERIREEMNTLQPVHHTDIRPTI